MSAYVEVEMFYYSMLGLLVLGLMMTSVTIKRDPSRPWWQIRIKVYDAHGARIL